MMPSNIYSTVTERLIFNTKSRTYLGTSYRSLLSQSRELYSSLWKNKNKRPYIKSKYFKNSKIFLDTFWVHLKQKNLRDKARRLKYYSCAIEVLEKSTYSPFVISTNTNKKEIYFRFEGSSRDGRSFIVQVKERKRSGQLMFMSVFPK